MLSILNSLARSGSSLPPILLRAAATTFPFTKYVSETTRSQPPLRLQRDRFTFARSFSTKLVADKKFPDEIIPVPKPEIAKHLPIPPIMTICDLGNLPKPSGPLDTGLLGAIVDYAGTIVDWGVEAPGRVFKNLVDERGGVTITREEAFKPMGKQKKRHLRQILLEDPEVRKRWKQIKGDYPDEQTVEELFKYFPYMQFLVLEELSEEIPGAAEACHNMKQRGLELMSSTGYLTGMSIFLRMLVEKIAKIRFPCDAERVPYGRPTTQMPALASMRSGIPAPYLVKIGDTQGDGLEGENNWTILFYATGPKIRMKQNDLIELFKTDPEEFKKLMNISFEYVAEVRPHFIASGAWELDPMIELIGWLCRSGYTPFDFDEARKKEVDNPSSLYKPALIPGYMQYWKEWYLKNENA